MFFRKLTIHFEIQNHPTLQLKKRKQISYSILVYHRILMNQDPYTIASISQKKFVKQIKYLKKNFHIISINQLLSDIKFNKLKPNTLCITFDDGYRDNYLYAFPVLTKFCVPATIYLTTDYINNNKLLWHDRVLNAIENTDLKYFIFENIDSQSFNFESYEKKTKSKYEILNFLKKFSPDIRDNLIEEFIKKCRVNSISSKYTMLSWEEIKIMDKQGISFGSHTYTHPILSTLNNVQLQQEIKYSKQIIEMYLDKPVISFAYPNGKKNDYDDRCQSFLENAGYECAVTTIWGTNNSDSDLFELNRISPIEYTGLQINGMLQYEMIKKVSQ